MEEELQAQGVEELNNLEIDEDIQYETQVKDQVAIEQASQPEESSTPTAAAETNTPKPDAQPEGEQEQPGFLSGVMDMVEPANVSNPHESSKTEFVFLQHREPSAY